MEDVMARLLRCLDRKNLHREVEEELHFHLELQIQEHLRQGRTLEEAKDEAFKRFGNVERVKNQCVIISRRSQPFMRALKSFLIVVFLVGVLARIFSADIYGRQIGNMLMVIAAFSRLLLYVRVLSLSSFSPKSEPSLPLGLSSDEQLAIAVKDRRAFRPVERATSDE